MNVMKTLAAAAGCLTLALGSIGCGTTDDDYNYEVNLLCESSSGFIPCMDVSTVDRATLMVYDINGEAMYSDYVRFYAGDSSTYRDYLPEGSYSLKIDVYDYSGNVIYSFDNYDNRNDWDYTTDDDIISVNVKMRYEAPIVAPTTADLTIQITPFDFSFKTQDLLWMSIYDENDEAACVVDLADKIKPYLNRTVVCEDMLPGFYSFELVIVNENYRGTDPFADVMAENYTNIVAFDYSRNESNREKMEVIAGEDNIYEVFPSQQQMYY